MHAQKKVLKKKPKKGAKPDAKPQTKTEDVPSFFNFFTPAEMPDEDAEMVSGLHCHCGM